MSTDALRAALAQATRVAVATHATLEALEAAGAPVAVWYPAWDIAVAAEMARYEAWRALQTATTWQNVRSDAA